MHVDTPIWIQRNIYTDSKTTWKTVFGSVLSEGKKYKIIFTQQLLCSKSIQLIMDEMGKIETVLQGWWN